MWGGLVSRATVANRRLRLWKVERPVSTGLQDAILPHEGLPTLQSTAFERRSKASMSPRSWTGTEFVFRKMRFLCRDREVHPGRWEVGLSPKAHLQSTEEDGQARQNHKLEHLFFAKGLMSQNIYIEFAKFRIEHCKLDSAIQQHGVALHKSEAR